MRQANTMREAKMSNTMGRVVATLGLLIAGLWVCAGLGSGASGQEGAGGRGRIAAVETWDFVKTRTDLDAVADVDADLIVLRTSLPIAQGSDLAQAVSQLKLKSNGERRLVLAYLGVGEIDRSAEQQWAEIATGDQPEWIVGDHCTEPGRTLVRFWHAEWRSLLHDAPGSRLGGIIEAGYDGVVLGRVDAYAALLGERPEARAEMIMLVKQVAAAARREAPGFLVLPHNGDALLVDPGLREAIDGIVREGLVRETGAGRDALHLRIERLKLLRSAGKQVLVVEQARSEADADLLRAEVRRHGFAPLIVSSQPVAPGNTEPAASPTAADPTPKDQPGLDDTAEARRRACISY